MKVSIKNGRCFLFAKNHIRAFNKEFEQIHNEEDCISKQLIKLYGKLSDVVHGRYNKLTNVEIFQIEYNIGKHKQTMKKVMQGIIEEKMRI